jgi:hypothetical protein
MKQKFLFLCVILSFSITLFAQSDKSKRPSPPAVAEGKADGASITVDYSQPSVKGRKIFGELIPYGKVWRTGANEATVITFDKDVTVEGQKLVAGKYSLWTIPGESEWTIIFNSKTDMWGTQYNKFKENDVLSVKVKPSKSGFTEQFTIKVNGNNVTLLWENTSVSFKVKG